MRSSPRPWGCFRFFGAGAGVVAVFPTPVGVFLRINDHRTIHAGLPHARGGVSIGGRCGRQFKKSSPRPWGCFRAKNDDFPCQDVFPTPVGVFLSVFALTKGRTSLPHARGGVSTSRYWVSDRYASSPRPWGCFQRRKLPFFPPSVFPTPVGVFPPCLATR